MNARAKVARAVAALSVLLSVLACGCIFPKAGPLPAPVSAADVDRARYRWSDVDQRSLAAGRELFAAHCNGCHQYPALISIPESDWPSIVAKMSRKAKLSAAQSELVLRFVLVARVR